MANISATVAIALAVLLLFWPTARGGSRLLRTWGIPDPDDDQVAEGVRYLRQRRILYVVLYVVLFFGLPPLAGLVGIGDARLPGLGVFGPLLVALLIAELFAVLRPVSGVRSASLGRRGWRDIVPRWAVVTATVLVALVVFFSAAVPAVPVQDRLIGLGYLVGCLVLVGLLVHLAVRRPAVTDETVASALRMRTARVAVGIGFGWLGAALTLITREDPSSWSYPALVLQLAAVVAWIWLANGTRRVW